MTDKPVPVRVKIDNKWYNSHEGFGSAAGALELTDSGKIAPTTEFIAREPYMHMSGFYFVHDMSGNKVGEIDINNNKCSGRVGSFELQNSAAAPGANKPERPFPQRAERFGCFGWGFALLKSFLLSNWGGKIGLIIGGVLSAILVFGTISSGYDFGNLFLYIPMALLMCGIPGAIIGAIVGFIKKRITKNR